MKIKLDPSPLHSGNSIAPISVEIDGAPFPRADWTDFLVGVMASWTENVVALSRDPAEPPPSQGRYQLSFVDGPWTILLQPAGQGRVEFLAGQKVPGSHTLPSIEVSIQLKEVVLWADLQREIQTAAQGVLGFCKVHRLGDDNPDVDALEFFLARLSLA